MKIPLSKMEWRALIILIVLIIGVYGQVVTHDFINYDDDKFILDNPHVSAGLSWEGVKWAFTTQYEANWHPVTWLSHMLDVSLAGLKPGWHHGVNLFFHLANTLLLLSFLFQTTRRYWPSLMVAALFALHPLHVESVAWVAERKDVLSTFFLLVTLGAYRRYTLNPGGLAYAKVLLLFMLGLMAKPMLVTLPLVLLILDFWPLDRLTRQNGDETVALSPVTLLLEKVPFAIIAASASFITYKAQQSWGATETLNRQDLWSNIGTALTGSVQYLYLTLFPFKLAVLYPYHAGVVYWQLLLSAAIIIALSAAAAFAIRTRPYLLAGTLWFFITLLPVSGIINIGFHDHADRYTYIPLTGVFIALVWFVADFCAERGWSRWSARLGIAVVLIVATATGLQVRYWKNSYTLFMHAIEVTSGNWLAHQHVSQYLLQSFRMVEAGDHIEASIRINPDNPNNYFILGSICRNLKQPDKAIRALERGVALNPYRASELSNLGVLYADSNRIDEALRIAEKLRALDPAYANSLQAYIHNRQRTIQHIPEFRDVTGNPP